MPVGNDCVLADKNSRSLETLSAAWVIDASDGLDRLAEGVGFAIDVISPVADRTGMQVGFPFADHERRT